MIQDQQYNSDFDNFEDALDVIKTTGKLPAKTENKLDTSIKQIDDEQQISSLDQILKKALDYKPNRENKNKDL